MAAKHNEKRRRGRPRRYAPGKRPTLTFRVQEDMHRDLAKTAKAKGYSISEEIEHRLTEWAQSKNMLEEAKTQLDVCRIQAIRMAGGQIVREAGGNVTVSVSPALLMTEAEGILRNRAHIQQETDPAIRAAMQSAGYGTTPAAAPEDMGSGFVAEENANKTDPWNDISPEEIMIQIRRKVETTIREEMKTLIAGVAGVLTEVRLREQTTIQQVIERAIGDALTKAGLIGHKGVA